VTFVSALVGFPPPIAIAIVAGATRVGFAPFVTLAATGRLVHFAVVAFLPELIRRFA
jgi:membrane protein YqaA with SNARE-associated domain